MKEFLFSEYSKALGWTLLHSLWQAMVVGLIMLIVLKFVARNSNSKYWVSVISLMVVFVWSGLSLFQQLPSENEKLISTQSNAFDWVYSASFGNSSVSFIETYLPLFVAMWVMGTLFSGVRLGWGMIGVWRLRASDMLPIADGLEQRFQAIAKNITYKTVRIAESAVVDTPLTIGHLKPFVLLPVGLVSSFTVSQLEAVVVHELAHIKRNDFLINIFQTVIESLFFFNPVVWLISKEIRKERENSCDDLAVSFCQSPLEYAKALQEVAQCNVNTNMAMALPGQKNYLLYRIKRIINTPMNNTNSNNKLLSALMIGLLITAAFAYGKTFELPKGINPEITQAGTTLELPFLDLETTVHNRTDYSSIEPPAATITPVATENSEISDFRQGPIKVANEIQDTIPGLDIEKFKEYLKGFKDGFPTSQQLSKEQSAELVELFKVFSSEMALFQEEIAEVTHSGIDLPNYRLPTEAEWEYAAEALGVAEVKKMRKQMELARHELRRVREIEEQKVIQETLVRVKELMAVQENEMERMQIVMKKEQARAGDELKVMMQEVQVLKEQEARMREFESVLKDELVKDGYIESVNSKIEISVKDGEMFINKKKIKSKDQPKYEKIRKKYFDDWENGRFEFNND